MQVRQLGDRVPHLLVNRSGDLAALHVHERNVHVRRGDGGGERLVAVGDRDHRIGPDVVEDRRQLRQADACRFRRRHEVLPLEHHVDTRDDRKPVALDRVDGVAVAIEQRGGRDDELQLEVAVLGDGLECGANPGVAGAGGDDDADFSFPQFRTSPSMSSAART